MRGVLDQMAEQGQLVSSAADADMLLPHGTYPPRAEVPTDAGLGSEHGPLLTLKADDGKREPANARLAHTACNREDQAWRLRIRWMIMSTWNSPPDSNVSMTVGSSMM